MNIKSFRIILGTIGFIGVLFLPPWVPVVCIVLLSLRFRAWEAILLGAFIDITWLPSVASLHSLPLFSIAALLIVWGFEPLRAQFLVAH
jgi:hypothetical protein